MPVPTPLEIAERVEGKRGRGSLDAITEALNSSFGRAVWVAEQAGSDVREELRSWIAQAGGEAVADWVSSGTSGAQIAYRWKESAARTSPSLLACLVEEEQLSTNAARVGTYLRGFSLNLQDSLMLVRERVARSALDAAFQASWARRTVFARALQVARTYLSFLIEAARLEGTEPRRSLVSRFGIATVLSARFAPTTQDELTKACESLLSAHELGADNALTYYLEGCIWRYDLFGEEDALVQASQRLRDFNASITTSVAWYLNSSEVWSKLIGTTANSQVRAALLRRAHGAVDDAGRFGNLTAEEAARHAMQSSLLEAFDEWIRSPHSDFKTQGVSFPFGHRTSHLEVPAAYRRAAPAIAEALSRHPRSTEYVFRDVRAELHSYLARREELNHNDKLWNLRKAIQLREGSKGNAKLRGSRVELALAEDQLRLAHLAGDVTSRREALSFLATRDDDDSIDAAKLTILAHDLETQGGLLGSLLNVDSDLAIAIRNGEAAVVYEEAASLAIRSPDVTRTELGGRGGVVALRDSDNTAGQTFVFKQMSEIALQRDSARTEELARLIDSRHLGSRFGVIEHIMVLRSPIPGLPIGPENAIVSIRRFRSGATLKEHIRSTHDGRAALRDVVEYLAFMHATATNGTDSGNIRKLLWEREVGRWLRPLGFEQDRRAVFEEWWSALKNVPLLGRRDAHAMNWLVANDGKILAVDLDATGARPFGYELAQLIEDSPILSPDDWDSRQDLLTHYCNSLLKYDYRLELSSNQITLAYRASMLARGLWALSSPDSTASERLHAGNLLRSIYRTSPPSRLRDVALRISQRWAEKIGVAANEQIEQLPEAERRRISRAMAYHLRHDPAVPATRDGWVHVEELTDLLIASGHKVSSQQLLFIAGALGEPRFELEGPEIRASYGHSRRTEIRYETKKPPMFLYHATPMENIASVLEAQAGLVRGKRLWVHLTDSCEVAERASRRQGKPVVILRIHAANIDTLVFASGRTWLAEHVNTAAIEVMPVGAVADLLRSESSTV